MSSLSIFQFRNSQVNTLIKDNEIWFLANDICKILDFKNPRTAVSNHCKPWGVLKQDTPTNSGVQSMIYINEPNLYRLIVKSRKPEAEDFEKKVFEEVLPAIRKTGSYSASQSAHAFDLISIEQQKRIHQAVVSRSKRTCVPYQKIYADLHAYLGIDSYKTMPVKHFTAAIKYLESMPDAPEVFNPNIDKQTLIKQDGRWLVIVKNNLVSHVQNIDGCNCVNAAAFRKLRMQTKQQAEYLLELAKRMRVVDGDCDFARLDVPIEELHPKFII